MSERTEAEASISEVEFQIRKLLEEVSCIADKKQVSLKELMQVAKRAHIIHSTLFFMILVSLPTLNDIDNEANRVRSILNTNIDGLLEQAKRRKSN